MCKILDAEDILGDARDYIECVLMAAASLSREEGNPISIVADAASKKIDEAIALLDESRHTDDDDQGGAQPSASEHEESQ